MDIARAHFSVSGRVAMECVRGNRSVISDASMEMHFGSVFHLQVKLIAASVIN